MQQAGSTQLELYKFFYYKCHVLYTDINDAVNEWRLTRFTVVWEIFRIWWSGYLR